MSRRWDKAARGVRSFVENPITILVKGGILVSIGLSEASRTFFEDLAHGHLRVGHGLIIIGLFNMLDSFPRVIEGLGAVMRSLDLGEEDERAREADGP